MDLDAPFESEQPPRRGRALVLVDNQNDFLHSEGLLGRLGMASDPRWLQRYVRQTNRVLTHARSTGMPVVHIVTSMSGSYAETALSSSWAARGFNATTGALIEGTWGAAMVDGLDVRPSDHFVVKKGHSAFQFTYLDRLLRNLAVRELYWTGGGVGGCLSDSIHMASSLGYRQHVVEDLVYPCDDPSLPSLWRHVGSVSAAVFCQGDASQGDGERTIAPECNSVRRGVALVVMDVQRSVLCTGGYATKVHGLSDQDLGVIKANIERLLEAARTGRSPIIFVNSVRWRGPETTLSGGVAQVAQPSFPRIGEPIDYLSGMVPQGGEYALVKFGGGAFTSTPLDRLLVELGASRVLLAGGDASGMGTVSETIRTAVGLGYSIAPIEGTLYADDGYLDGPLSHRATPLGLLQACGIVS